MLVLALMSMIKLSRRWRARGPVHPVFVGSRVLTFRRRDDIFSALRVVLRMVIAESFSVGTHLEVGWLEPVKQEKSVMMVIGLGSLFFTNGGGTVVKVRRRGRNSGALL